MTARGRFGPEECERFLAAKERLWQEHGYGPWAFVIDGEFAGWGGIQPEGGDAHAFGELGFHSVIALLPPSRTRIRAVLKLGFRTDGDTTIAGERFIRCRLQAPLRPTGSNSTSDDAGD